MNLTNKTIDELDELLAWIADRRRYCIKCGIAGCQEDNHIEYLVLTEIARRENR